MQRLALVAVALACGAVPAMAQDSETPAAPETAAEWMTWMPDPASLTMPALAYEETQENIDNYEKYYYFHREDTDFDTALADLRECDGHSRGLFRGNYSPDPTAAMVQYGVVGGAVGGLIAGAIANAIFGPAELRRKRRINMRRCMFFKGYSRFGLDEDLWNEFNFEEGASEVAERDRQEMLAVQALVASGPRPTTEELGL